MRKSVNVASERASLLRLLDEAYNKKAWHGPNLRGSIRRVAPAQAVWRAGPGRRNIAETVLHCAYWKYAVRRRIRGDKRGSFPLKGSNWFAIPQRLTKEDWRAYVAILDSEHRALREAISTTPWTRLAAVFSGEGKDPALHGYALALHDVYHAGQIQAIKALYKHTVDV